MSCPDDVAATKNNVLLSRVEQVDAPFEDVTEKMAKNNISVQTAELKTAAKPA